MHPNTSKSNNNGTLSTPQPNVPVHSSHSSTSVESSHSTAPSTLVVTTSSSASSNEIRKGGKNLIKPDSEHGYMLDEIKDYSITPDTFDSRILKQIHYLSEDFIWFIDSYKYGTSAVERYGINAAKFKEFKTSTKPINKVNVKPEIIVNSNKQEQLVDVSTSEAKKPGLKGGSKGTSNHSQRANSAASVVHEDLEVNLIQKAVDYLITQQSTKAVLVDIFRRDVNDGCIELKEGIAEVHTVVLYKIDIVNSSTPSSTNKTSGNSGKYVPKYNILVIDPSNFSFSTHIANLQDKVSEGLSKKEAFVKFITNNSKIGIYKVPENQKTGGLPNQYRDCIDIAVKLAFQLNSDEQLAEFCATKLTDATIKSNQSFSIISNQKDIDGNFVKFGDNEATRIKQTSNSQVREKFLGLETFINLLKEKLLSSIIQRKQQEKIAEKLDTMLIQEFQKSFYALDKQSTSEILQNIKEFGTLYQQKCWEIVQDSILPDDQESSSPLIGE